MEDADKGMLLAIAIAIIMLGCFGYAVWYIGKDRECLIYGVDYNGRNDEFGLFCK